MGTFFIVYFIIFYYYSSTWECIYSGQQYCWCMTSVVLMWLQHSAPMKICKHLYSFIISSVQTGFTGFWRTTKRVQQYSKKRRWGGGGRVCPHIIFGVREKSIFPACPYNFKDRFKVKCEILKMLKCGINIRYGAVSEWYNRVLPVPPTPLLCHHRCNEWLSSGCTLHFAVAMPTCIKLTFDSHTHWVFRWLY